MSINLDFDQTTVKKSLKLLSILSKKDNMTIFFRAADRTGLNADSSTPTHLGICKKTYYTRLKQLITAGLVRKDEGTYVHTTLGKMIYQKHLELMDQIRNIKHFKMIDALKGSKEFSDDDIQEFIEKLVSENSHFFYYSDKNPHVQIFWKYEEMISTLIQRIETCKKELLLASRYINESIISGILNIVQSGIKVRVITGNFMINQSINQNQHSTINLKGEDTSRISTAVRNQWFAANINRRTAELPFSMVILDSKEVGIELIHANNPKAFNGAIFVNNEKVANIMAEYYQKIWETSPDEASFMASEPLAKRSLVSFL
jgi:predicted transcriptional regulator